MTAKLLKKDFFLAMHPTVPVMLLLSAMVFIPNYPYIVIFFYLTLSLFFTCLLGRENKDVNYTLLLTFSKKKVVFSRLLFFCITEITQLLLTLIFVLIKQRFSPLPNSAGMDANIALLGSGFLSFGIFNFVFIRSYYKDIQKVGLSFLKSCLALFIFCAADIVATYAIAFVKNFLDTPDNSFLTQKIIFVLLCALLFSLLTFSAYHSAVKSFEKYDIT